MQLETVAGRIAGASRLYRRIELVEETGSTNRDVIELATAGEDGGLVYVAGHQTAGEGQRGRSWYSAPDSSILMSLLLRELTGITSACAGIVMALAVAEALESVSGARFVIKWPNDVLSSAGRKICGILPVASYRGSKIEWLVKGVGVNINLEDFGLLGQDIALQPTSLSLEMGRTIAESEKWLLLEQILLCYEQHHLALADGNRAPLRAVEQRLAGVGKMATVFSEGQ